MKLFNSIFGPLIESKSVIFMKILPPGPGSKRKRNFNQQRFLGLYPTRTRSSSQIIWQLDRGKAVKLYGTRQNFLVFFNLKKRTRKKERNRKLRVKVKNYFLLQFVIELRNFTPNLTHISINTHTGGKFLVNCILV